MLPSNTDLSRVKYGEDVNESFMYRREETEYPRDTQQGNHHHAWFDANSKS